jgi:hypothetical protein
VNLSAHNGGSSAPSDDTELAIKHGATVLFCNYPLRDRPQGM